MKLKTLLGNKKALSAVVALIMLTAITLGVSLVAYSNRNNAYVARVNGAGITKDAYNQQLASLQFFYSQSGQKIDESMLKKNVLDTLIDNQLLQNYATEKQITINQEAINASYQQRVSAYKTEQDFLAALNKMYNTDKTQYQETIRQDLLREAVQKAVNQPLDTWLRQQRSTASISIYIHI